MCQLLGLSFSQEITLGQYFPVILSRSTLHPHGWGIAYHPRGSTSAVVYKEPIAGSESELARFLCRYNAIKSNIFICHIRKASRGSVAYDNTHPFSRCYAGREYTFAHNGTLKYRMRLTGLVYKPMGETDSERAFCFLLSQLRRCEIKRIRTDRVQGYSSTDFRTIYEILVDINTRTEGAFNCLFSDGMYLFCYRDLQEARNLFYQKCKSSIKNSDIVNFESEKNPYMEHYPVQDGYIVATEPINSNEWQSFAGGQLMVFKDGQVVVDIC